MKRDTYFQGYSTESDIELLGEIIFYSFHEKDYSERIDYKVRE